MAKNIGIVLFSGRGLQRFMEALPSEVTRWARYHYDEERLRGDALVSRLRERFHLQPVVLGPVMTLTVGADALPYRKGKSGTEQTGYLAYARLPWSGSDVWLRTRIDSTFQASFAGKIGKTAVRLGRFVDTLDLTGFRSEALAEVDRMRDTLQAFRPRAVELDAAVLREVEGAVRADNLT